MCRINICKIILIFAFVSTTVKFGYSKYENHKIIEIKPKTQEFINILKKLETQREIYILNAPISVNKNAIIMVSSSELSKYYNLIFDNNISYRFLYEDACEWHEKQNKTKIKRSVTGYFYRTLDQIYEQLDDLVRMYPDKVQIIVGGRSYENRQIKGAKVSFGGSKPGVFIEGGVHGNEWISPATVMYILFKLLVSDERDVIAMAKKYDWYIFPVFNPDGYVYTHTNNRYWYKTRKPYHDTCIGADLSRNWNYQWNSNIRQKNPCSMTYPGDTAFSEIEAKTMSEYIKTISDKLYAYISIQNNGRYILFPYGYTEKNVENYNELMAIAKAMRRVIKKKYKIEVYVGSIAKTYAKIRGTTMDYIRGIYGTRLVYMYQLPHPDGYMVPEKDIIPIGRRTLDSFLAMFKEAEAQENKRN